MTPDAFKTAKPQFADVDNAVIQAFLDLAALLVTDEWPAAYRDAGTVAYTCHLLTLEGLGTDSESVGFADGTAHLQEIRSGSVTLKRFADAAAGSSYSDWLRSTTCGKTFYYMARGIRGGPRLVATPTIAPSGYAKDSPLIGGWPLVFYG